MTTERARRLLLDRLGSTTTLLLAILLDLPCVPAWCDGTDAAGRAVLLVGHHTLGDAEAAQEAVTTVLESLKAGEVPEGVLAIAYAPKAAECIAEVVAGAASEVLADGPRGSGKTQAVPAALAILAELHARAGYSLPFTVLWLHDSMVNAGLKTGRSLEQPLWGGLWSLRDDRREAVFTLAGTEMIRANFVGTRDESASERSRAECHSVAVEELVPSLDEAGGIEERKYELALTSMRLPTRRRVAISTTNPGSPDTWPYRRWIEGGGRPGCVRCPIPAEDRLTPEEVTALRQAFRDSPDLEQRLALGEWAELVLGERVAVGYNPEAHVAAERLRILPGEPLWMGHDGGHTPTTVIGQLVEGFLHLLAGLVTEKAGMRQHLEQTVLPWLALHAPWIVNRGGELIHRYDPSLDTGDDGDIDQSPMQRIRATLGGLAEPGATTWPARRDPMLAVFNLALAGRPVLQIDPGPDTELLRRALAGRWYYKKTPSGQILKDLPHKPNHPWEDLGDCFCYLIGGMAPGRVQPAVKPTWDHALMSFDLWHHDRPREGQADMEWSPFRR